MSRRSQKRKLYDNHHKRAWEVFCRRYDEWRYREPSRWRIFAWLRWKKECPHKPKDAVEYDEMLEKYPMHRDRWSRWFYLW